MMSTGQIPECRPVESAVLEMAMTLTKARVKRTCRVVKHGPGKGWQQRMARGKGRQLRTGMGMGMGRGRQRLKRRGMGREMGKGKVLLNKPQGR